MPNMSYCRFENTFKDLTDCQDALANANSIEEYENTCNAYEKPFVKKLIELCKEIAENFGDEIED